MRYEKENKRFFHASPRRFQVGQTLTASRQVKKNYQWCEQGIFVTDKPAAHHTIYYDIQNKGWHLYEVEPLCRMKRGWYVAEWIANQVVIINYVGVIGGRLGNFISGQTLQNTKPFLSLNKPPFQAFVVPHDSEYRTCFEGEYAKPNGEMSETLLNKGFENYDFAEAWAKAKAQKGDIIYIFDRRKNGNTQRIRKERVKV